MGVLSIIDRSPRDISEDDLQILTMLAQIVMDEMELRLSSLRIHELNQKLKTKATQDCLTGLLNRESILSLLEQSIAAALQEERPLSVIMIDVDFFEEINHQYGYKVGDSILGKVAEHIKSSLQDQDHLGRYDGDKFLLILQPCDAEHARNTAEQIRKTINEQQFEIDGKNLLQLTISISAGVSSTATAVDPRAHRLVKQAIDALKVSKHNGGNQVTAG